MESKRRVAIVTGGGQGIGKAVALRLLVEGMAVFLAEKDREAGEETEQEFHEIGWVRFAETDVSDEGSVERMVERALREFGRIDALVNNAGIASPAQAPVEELPLEEWRRVLDTNLTGVFLCSRAAAPHLRRSHGSVVNIASTRASMSEPNTEAYAASKGGVVALTHALAVSLGPDVRVNCISPGWIDVSEWKKASRRRPAELTAGDHAQHPAGRVGQPEDVADMAAFLLSDEAGFITGQNFVVDGGMTRRMRYD